jgi:uncharacterized Zn finger protein
MVKKETRGETKNLPCDKCQKITTHRVTYARILSGTPKTLKRKQPIKAECLECGNIRRDMQNLI